VPGRSGRGADQWVGTVHHGNEHVQHDDRRQADVPGERHVQQVYVASRLQHKKTNVKHRLYRAKLASAVNMLWPRDCPSVGLYFHFPTSVFWESVLGSVKVRSHEIRCAAVPRVVLRRFRRKISQYAARRRTATHAVWTNRYCYCVWSVVGLLERDRRRLDILFVKKEAKLSAREMPGIEEGRSVRLSVCPSVRTTAGNTVCWQITSFCCFCSRLLSALQGW